MSGLSDNEIASIEARIGNRLPDDVRQAYAKNNGLRGPTGIWLLYPYGGDPNVDIVHLNAGIKGEDWFPAELLDYSLIGDDGCGGMICAPNDGSMAAIWYPAQGAHFQEQRSSVSEIWELIRQLYVETEAELDNGESSSSA